MGLFDRIKDIASGKSVEDLLDKFPKSNSSFGYDPWGFNLNSVRTFLGFGKILHENYFKVEAQGLENIPQDGRVLIIGNHSGQLPLDGFLLAYTLLSNPEAPRAFKTMMERFIPTVPFFNSFFAEIGGVVGDPINCSRMLEAEEGIIVFPEGSRGISKPYSKRYQLQKFGTGFMNLAVNHKTPIIPVGIVGMEESIVQLANPKGIANMLGIPSAPLLVPFLFPTKVYFNFGKPMYFESDMTREDTLEAYVDDVKKEINTLIQTGLKQRKGIYAFQ